MISSQFFVEKILWSPGFLYVLTVSLEKVQARHNLPHDNDAKPTNKIYIPHFNFPVRRTGTYRHKKALPYTNDGPIGTFCRFQIPDTWPAFLSILFN